MGQPQAMSCATLTSDSHLLAVTWTWWMTKGGTPGSAPPLLGFGGAVWGGLEFVKPSWRVLFGWRGSSCKSQIQKPSLTSQELLLQQKLISDPLRSVQFAPG